MPSSRTHPPPPLSFSPASHPSLFGPRPLPSHPAHPAHRGYRPYFLYHLDGIHGLSVLARLNTTVGISLSSVRVTPRTQTVGRPDEGRVRQDGQDVAGGSRTEGRAVLLPHGVQREIRRRRAGEDGQGLQCAVRMDPQGRDPDERSCSSTRISIDVRTLEDTGRAAKGPSRWPCAASTSAGTPRISTRTRPWS